jgi:hypothetical protein
LVRTVLCSFVTLNPASPAQRAPQPEPHGPGVDPSKRPTPVAAHRRRSPCDAMRRRKAQEPGARLPPAAAKDDRKVEVSRTHLAHAKPPGIRVRLAHRRIPPGTYTTAPQLWAFIQAFAKSSGHHAELLRGRTSLVRVR